MFWIRNQDKNKLVECNHFEIEKLELSHTSDKKEYIIDPFSEEELEKFNTKNDIEILDTKVINKLGPFGYYDVVIISYREIKKQTKYVIKDSNCILGEYSTEEKALNVLDMIETFINNSDRYLFESVEYNSEWVLRKVSRKSVFQIPQDNEVQ